MRAFLHYHGRLSGSNLYDLWEEALGQKIETRSDSEPWPMTGTWGFERYMRRASEALVNRTRELVETAGKLDHKYHAMMLFEQFRMAVDDKVRTQIFDMVKVADPAVQVFFDVLLEGRDIDKL